METSVAVGEDKKPEMKSEPKEEDVGSGTPSTPAGMPNKKKSEDIFHNLHLYQNDVISWLYSITHDNIIPDCMKCIAASYLC